MAKRQKQRVPAEQFRRARAFMEWSTARAAAEGHVLTSIDEWAAKGKHGHSGWKASCSCGWRDESMVGKQTAAVLHAYQHLGEAIGDTLGVDARSMWNALLYGKVDRSIDNGIDLDAVMQTVAALDEDAPVDLMRYGTRGA